MSSPTSSTPGNGKGKSAVLCQAAASYKKKNGQLTLTRTHLVWSQQGSTGANGDLSFVNERLNTLFMSKEGGAKVVMKVNVLDLPGGSNEESYNFTFTSGPSAVSDREHFKREISTIISRNKAAMAAAAASAVVTAPSSSTAHLAPGSPAAAAGTAGAIPSTSATAAPAFNGLPSPAQAAANASTSTNGTGAGASTSVSGAAAASSSEIDPTKDLRVRKKILMDNPDLYALHTDLVRTGAMSEEEFWEGREYMLRAEYIAQSIGSNPGRSAQIVDPRPEQTESGDIRITLTKNLIKDIFDQYPIVQKAYNDNVPEPLSEAEFWHRYFHSKLFDRHRTSGRSSITGQASGNIKDDAIFDKYLEDPDDDLEPKHFNMQRDDIYRLLDLAATEEDHGEATSIKDFTMRAGSQKKSLPLMRRFNEHSERLLAQALGEATPHNRSLNHLHGGDAGARQYYSDIILEDLQGEERDEVIPLNVGDSSDAYAGAAATTHDTTTTNSNGRTAGDDNKENGSSKNKQPYHFQSKEEADQILQSSRKRLKSWHPNLAQFHLSRSSASFALQSLQGNIQARLGANSSSSSSSSSNNHANMFPEHILRAMISCQASANEFLRHFWSAVLPARPDDISASSMATPVQKAGKAQRMITYLEKTQERVDTVVSEAKKASADDAAVREALEPCMGAVKRALDYYHSRVKGK